MNQVVLILLRAEESLETEVGKQIDVQFFIFHKYNKLIVTQDYIFEIICKYINKNKIISNLLNFLLVFKRTHTERQRENSKFKKVFSC